MLYMHDQIPWGNNSYPTTFVLLLTLNKQKENIQLYGRHHEMTWTKKVTEQKKNEGSRIGGELLFTKTWAIIFESSWPLLIKCASQWHCSSTLQDASARQLQRCTLFLELFLPLNGEISFFWSREYELFSSCWKLNILVGIPIQFRLFLKVFSEFKNSSSHFSVTTLTLTQPTLHSLLTNLFWK